MEKEHPMMRDDSRARIDGSGRKRCKDVTKPTVGVIPKGLALLVFLGVSDIDKKTNTRPKPTKLSTRLEKSKRSKPKAYPSSADQPGPT
ncbi:hypothetical protein Tco_1385469 [Tanacetum coccineum]